MLMPRLYRVPGFKLAILRGEIHLQFAGGTHKRHVTS
ncbi:hypothetical protein ACVMGC_009552 [Bradyrhizobium barranii subsp. barranii]|nr:hypothetical protein [Bradyrhizobium japonicum]MCP1857138.1 hypothetical protein [Bradyrhizobium japonicum]MCP1887953.1 hypothetical protein [Bradyrhizobium japonicum]MCP1959354.1 hypothetical protein [Bradyrhizobium japonicum]MCW2320927.1 hypothetical protein [Bradyrhizobium japonicum]